MLAIVFGCGGGVRPQTAITTNEGTMTENERIIMAPGPEVCSDTLFVYKIVVG